MKLFSAETPIERLSREHPGLVVIRKDVGEIVVTMSNPNNRNLKYMLVEASYDGNWPIKFVPDVQVSISHIDQNANRQIGEHAWLTLRPETNNKVRVIPSNISDSETGETLIQVIAGLDMFLQYSLATTSGRDLTPKEALVVNDMMHWTFAHKRTGIKVSLTSAQETELRNKGVDEDDIDPESYKAYLYFWKIANRARRGENIIYGA